MAERTAIKWYEPLFYLLVTAVFGLLAIVVGVAALLAFTVELMSKPGITISKIAAAASVCAFVCLGALWVSYTSEQSLGERVVSVTVDSQTTFNSLTDELTDSGLIESPRLFRYAARLRGVDRRLMVGRYDFRGEVSVKSTLDRLASGDVATVLLTIPEGLTVWKTAGLLQAQLGFDSAAAVKYLTDSAALQRRFELSALEGYLFPETYRFPVGVSLSTVVAKMVADAKATLTELRSERSSEFSELEVLTLASIIEAEATIASERETISSVYQNRLKRGMLLQADPTVRYALNLYHRKLYYKDLEVDNPYNTYRYPGLPPGPINSPGRASIAAALNPAETEFFYFVADGSGGHIFNTDLAGHNRSKAQLKANGVR